MKHYTTIPFDLPPTALTIGTFDGIHLGHQALLQRLRECASHTTVLTFTNHPLEILRAGPPPQLLLSLPEKLALLETLGIDSVIAIPFTLEIANLSYQEFLKPFHLTHLLLGTGDAFGKNREGNLANLTRLAAEKKFALISVDKIALDGQPISSRRIRAALAANDLELASRLLGRPLQKELYV